jgi:hypothetical protein
MLIEGSNSFEDVAWPMLLFGKLLNNICVKGKLYSYFTSDEVKEAAFKIAQIVSVVKETRGEKAGGIEPDVLLLSMYDLAYALTKSEQYRESENELRTRSLNDIMAKLVEAKDRGHVLQEDARAIFMAAYIYPILMSNEEWIKCFDILLEAMHHTFEIFKSKMRQEMAEGPLKLELFGLQSLAAIVLNRLDPEHYESNINRILRTSVDEVLYKGIIGRPTSSFDHDADPEKEALIEDAHLLNNALFLEMLRECA